MHAIVRPAPGARATSLLLGCLLCSIGSLLTIRADVGNGPFYAVQDGLHRTLGIGLGPAAIVMGLALVAVAALLRAPIGPGTLLIPVLIGVQTAAIEPLVPAVHGPTDRWVAFLVGTTVLVLGGVVAIRAGMGAAAIDGVMLGLARATGSSPGAVRLAMEAALALAGVALRGEIGPGTVVMGLLVGHLFTFWSQALQRAPVRWVPARRRTDPCLADVPGSEGPAIARRSSTR